MCRELFLVYPRCGHPQSSMGIIYHCLSYARSGRTCVNDHGQLYKDYEFRVEDTRTQCFVDDRRNGYPIQGEEGGWKAEIEQGYKGYCHNCLEGRTEPMEEKHKEEFLDGYLGEYERWQWEREKRFRLAKEQAKLIEQFTKEKGAENEGWIEVD